MPTDVSVRVKQEGAQSFSDAFKQATSSVRALDSALKLNAAEMQNSDNRMDSMKQKSALLSKEIEAQKNVVKLAQEEHQRLVEQYGQGSTQVNNYEKKVNDANTKLEKLKTELNDNEKAMQSFGNETRLSGDQISAFGQKVSDLGNKLKWLSVGATAALTAMFNSASDLDENLNKTSVVFGDLGDEIESWSQTTLDSYGIAQSSALEMISLFGDMATSMGIATDEAAKMGQELVGRAGDMASFKNVSLETAQSGLSAIFTGNAASLRRFGIVMTEANLQAYALSEGITKQYKDMTQAEQVMLRYQYVMEMTKNSAGDFANTSDGAANSVRVAQESLKEAAATLGQELIPVVVPLIQDVTELIKGVNALDEGTKNLIVRGLAITAVASPILSIAGTLIKGVGWLAGLGGGATGVPAVTAALTTMQTGGTAALGALSSALGITTAAATTLLGVLGALVVAAGAAVAVLVELNKEQREAEQIARKSELTAGKQQISAADAQYYRPEDMISVWNGSEFEYWANTGSISAQGYNAQNARANGWQMDEYGNVIESNTYNIDMNVANVSDLQNLVDIADTAKMTGRMN